MHDYDNIENSQKAFSKKYGGIVRSTEIVSLELHPETYVGSTFSGISCAIVAVTTVGKYVIGSAGILPNHLDETINRACLDEHLQEQWDKILKNSCIEFSRIF